MKAPISAMAAEAGYDKLSEGRRLISAQRFLKAGRIRREESEALKSYVQPRKKPFRVGIPVYPEYGRLLEARWTDRYSPRPSWESCKTYRYSVNCTNSRIHITLLSLGLNFEEIPFIPKASKYNRTSQ